MSIDFRISPERVSGFGDEAKDEDGGRRGG